jgi:hypothetical protein
MTHLTSAEVRWMANAAAMLRRCCGDAARRCNGTAAMWRCGGGAAAEMRRNILVVDACTHKKKTFLTATKQNVLK